MIKKNKYYEAFFTEIKNKIENTQIKAALAVNNALLQFYWELGKSITEKQAEHNWGSGLMEQLEIDLRKVFPGIDGFSRTNLYFIKQFYLFYSQLEFVPQVVGQIAETVAIKGKRGNKSTSSIVPQPVGQLENNVFVPQVVGQIPWGHHRLILDKIKEPQTAIFYLKQTIANNWSRNVLAMQIESSLHKRQGKAITNFKATLLKAQSDLALQTLKDPYTFDFITLHKDAQEKDIELQLINSVTQFLLELGQGFAFMGRQYHLEVARKDN